MIKESNFPNACKEVYTILKFVDENDLRKIPQEFIEIIETNMNKLYEFEYNPNIELDKQDILKETKVIFAHIFFNFWATEKQCEIIKTQFKKDVITDEENKRKNIIQMIFLRKKKLTRNIKKLKTIKRLTNCQ